MNPLPPTNSREPLGLARPLALLIGLAVVALSGLAWGPRGSLAAAIGTAISIANVFLLARLGARAVREAAGGEVRESLHAATRLHGALGAKTIILLVLVAILANGGPISGDALTPFTLGLLVTVFALVAGGLLAPLWDRDPSSSTSPTSP